jgi:hypothetical protein
MVMAGLGVPDERVMLIRADLGDGVSVGSGTLVGPKLVLTAAHVVFGDNGEPVAMVGLGPPEAEPVRGTVVWPGSYMPQGGPKDQDAALIEIVDERWVPPGLGPARWGWLTGRTPGVACEAKGFPRVLRDPNGTRDWDHVTGEINPSSHRIARRYDLKVTSPVPQLSTNPRAPSPWSGMSGAGVFASGRLIGVLIIDEPGYRADRLSAVPVHRLAGDPSFADIIEASDAGLYGPEYLESVELAGLISAPMLRGAGKHRQSSSVSPATLLRADQEVVPFHGRDPLLTELTSWCNQKDPRVGVRLLVGPGGQGKTRLARHLAWLMVSGTASKHRWVAGFLTPDPDPPAAAPELSPLASSAFPLLVVVDYAEARKDQLRRLLPQLWDADSSTQVRLLLLARGAEDWWENLLQDCDELEDAVVLRLSTLDDTLDSRHDAFAEALLCFAERLKELDASEQHAVDTSVVEPPEELDADRYGSPLTLQMSALLALLPVTATSDASGGLTDSSNGLVKPRDISLEARILDHEKRYWKRSAKARGLDLSINTLGAVVAAATLLGADSQEEALATLSRVPGARDQSEDRRLELCNWLEDLYPASPGQRWGTLQPDRLAEHHVSEIVRKSPDFLNKLVKEATGGQIARALSLLTRATDHQPYMKSQLRDLLERDKKHIEPIVIDRLRTKLRASLSERSKEENVLEPIEDPDVIWNSYLEHPVVLI